MGIVAVAGGNGDLGKTIVEQLVATGKQKIFVLSRKGIPTPIKGTETLVVDYDDVEGTSLYLNQNKVDTIIATLGPGSAEAQIKLIQAAETASSAKRFITSDFGPYISPEDAGEFYADFQRVADALRKTRLQFTRFANGIFMDYFGAPNIPSHLRSFVWGVDVRGRRAAIPGSGDDVMAMTYSKDVARYVDRILDDEDWSEWSFVSGSDTTFNQLLALAKIQRGQDFDVIYDSAKKLAKGDATVLSSDASYGGADPKEMCAYLGMSLIDGKLQLPKEGRLNERYPEIKPLTIDQLLAQAWEQK